MTPTSRATPIGNWIAALINVFGIWAMFEIAFVADNEPRLFRALAAVMLFVETQGRVKLLRRVAKLKALLIVGKL